MTGWAEKRGLSYEVPLTPKKEPESVASETLWAGGQEKKTKLKDLTCFDAGLVKTLFTLIHNKLSW